MQPDHSLQQEAVNTTFVLRYLLLLLIAAVLIVGTAFVLIGGLTGSGITYRALDARETDDAVIMRVEATPDWKSQWCGWTAETFTVVGKKETVLWVFDGDVKWVRDDGQSLPDSAQKRLNDALSVLAAKQDVLRSDPGE